MASNSQYRNIYGIILMLTHSFAASMLYAVNKYLTEFVSSNQMVFLYKSIVLIGIVPWILHGGLACLKTQKFKLHLLRGVVSTIAALCFFYGLSKVSIASATALNKMEPVLLMVIGVLYFRERFSISKAATVVISFVGMLFVIYPVITMDESGIHFMELSGGLPEVNYNYLIILCAVLLWTINSSVVKVLGKTESNRTQLFYVSLISVIVSFPAAMFTWSVQSFAGSDILWINEVSPFSGLNSQVMWLLLIVAVMHFIHVTCYFQSLKVGEMSVVIPFDYSRLIIGGVLGYVFFGSTPSMSANIGYIFILSAGVYLLRVQSKLKRSSRLLEDEQS
jgi:drug/metabolite transporter (DMT)-like permease